MKVRFKSGRIPIVVIGMLASLINPITCIAAEWTAEPAVTVRRDYHDNISLSVHPQNSVQGTIVTPSLDLAMREPTWHINSGLSATQRRYSGASGLDQDDTSIRISSAYMTERNTWQLSASRLRASLLTGEQISADTGVVQTQRQSETKNVTPAWTWMYSPRTQLQLQYLWSEVSYDNSQNAGLYDYRYQSATATLSNQISERNQVFVTGGYSKFHVPFTEFESDTGNIQLGATRNFSETTIGTLQAGLRNTESTTRGGDPVYTRFSTIVNGQIVDVLVQTGVTQESKNEDTSTVFSGNLEKKFDKATVRMTLSRTLSPSGSGGQANQDSYYITFNNPLSARLLLTADGNVIKTRNFQGNITNSELTYYEVSTGLEWQWLHDLNLGLKYRRARADRAFEATVADSNAIFLTLSYRPLKLSVSR